MLCSAATTYSLSIMSGQLSLASTSALASSSRPPKYAAYAAALQPPVQGRQALLLSCCGCVPTSWAMGDSYCSVVSELLPRRPWTTTCRSGMATPWPCCLCVSHAVPLMVVFCPAVGAVVVTGQQLKCLPGLRAPPQFPAVLLPRPLRPPLYDTSAAALTPPPMP